MSASRKTVRTLFTLAALALAAPPASAALIGEWTCLAALQAGIRPRATCNMKVEWLYLQQICPDTSHRGGRRQQTDHGWRVPR